jgi:hypothetical protein
MAMLSIPSLDKSMTPASLESCALVKLLKYFIILGMAYILANHNKNGLYSSQS